MKDTEQVEIVHQKLTDEGVWNPSSADWWDRQRENTRGCAENSHTPRLPKESIYVLVVIEERRNKIAPKALWQSHFESSRCLLWQRSNTRSCFESFSAQAAGIIKMCHSVLCWRSCTRVCASQSRQRDQGAEREYRQLAPRMSTHFPANLMLLQQLERGEQKQLRKWRLEGEQGDNRVAERKRKES